MRFGLSEEQRLFDNSLRSFLSSRLPVEALRQMVWALLTSAEFRFNY